MIAATGTHKTAPARATKSAATVEPTLPDRVAGWLSHSTLFSHLSMRALTPVATACITQTCPAGSTLFMPGSRADGFYVVVYGSVSLSLPGPDGTEKLIELVGPGECFGQAAMFLEVPYPIAGRCLTETLLLQVPKEPFFVLLDQDPVLTRKMLTIMAMRMHRRIHDIEGYAFRSAASRLADFLLSLQATSGNTVRLPVSKSVLASKLLFTPATLSRILKEWMEAGHIAVSGRSITLCDLAALQSIGRCDRS